MAIVAIDTQKCIEVARHIRENGGVPPDREDPMLYSFPVEIVHNAWFAMVGINQQTTPVVGLALRGSVNGVKLRGWDYLLQKAIFASNQNYGMFSVDWFLNVTPDSLRALYHDQEEGATLNQAEARAMLLNDLGAFLKRKKWESIHEAYLESGGYLVRSDGKGIIQVIAGAKAYQDPVQKKAYYFLAIMKNEELWRYKDILNLGPPVNYHEQRLHLRLGTIKIIDAEFERKIRNRENITDQEDIEIRFAVRRVIEFISQLLEATPSSEHYQLWNHARNCCSRDNPHCAGCGSGCKLPERYRVSGVVQCLFAPVCKSAGLGLKNILIEPRLDDTIWQ